VTTESAEQSFIADEYRDLSPLQTRILTHQRYSEGVNDVDLDVIRAAEIGPAHSVLDIGSGTGEFLRRLRAEQAHTGRLVAFDASAAAVEAAAALDGVEGVLGDAQSMPFAEEEFDVVTARHMLYHVPDPVLAIREARRVLRPGGRFAAVVNRVDPTPMMTEAVDTVLRGFGSAVPGGGKTEMPVHAQNLPGMVDEVFGAVRVVTVNGALVFTEPEPVIRYCLSTLTLSGVPQEGPLRAEVEAGVEAEVRRRFDELGGVWRDPKGYIVCVAEKSA
jgi:ubiquinone/menaquinone biosynthesis C-methylase UbiE